LEELEGGQDGPAVEAELDAARQLNAQLLARRGEFLGARSDPGRLGSLMARAVTLYEEAVNRLWSVGAYAGLAASVSRDDPSWAIFEADIRAKSSAIAADSLFLTLELNALDDADVEAALAAEQ